MSSHHIVCPSLDFACELKLEELKTSRSIMRSGLQAGPMSHAEQRELPTCREKMGILKQT